MSNDPFPERVTPRKLCNRNGSINSTIPLGKLLRFSEYLHDDHGQAEVYLSFDRDETGYCFLSGTVKAEVSMICQRCLEATRVTLASGLAIKIAEDDAEAAIMAATASQALDTLEIVVCDEGELDLLAVVEDELIMSLPIVASHSDNQCSPALKTLQGKTGGPADHSKGNIQGLEELEKLKQVLQEQGNDKNRSK